MQKQEDIADSSVNLDGPQPMKNLKPIEPNKNSVDRFNECHNQNKVHETRSSDRVQRVRRHNAACPKLIDEIDKRKSLTKVTVYNSKNNKRRAYHHKCKYEKNKRSTTGNKSKCKRNKSRLDRRGVKKTKPSKNSSILHGITKGSQCHYVLVKNRKLGVNFGNTNMELIDDMIENTTDNVIIKASAPKTPASSAANSKMERSQNSTNYPDTSIASMSSYNSFATLDQEPMV